jgi:hypothetical protein
MAAPLSTLAQAEGSPLASPASPAPAGTALPTPVYIRAALLGLAIGVVSVALCSALGLLLVTALFPGRPGA